MRLVVKSNFTPPFTYDSDSPPSGASGFLLKLVKPSVVATDIPFIGDKTYEPYGPPSGWGIALLLALAGLSVYGGYALARRYL